MSAAEQEIEDLARTVTCPVCKRRPGKACITDRDKKARRVTSEWSHTGRLKLARGES